MENLKKYTVINNNLALDEFNNVVEILKLKRNQISYLSLGMKDYETNNGTTIIPNLEWKETVEKKQIYHLDPIFVAATLTKKDYVFYSRFHYNTALEKEILAERKNLEMNKGFIKLIHFETFRIAFTYSTGLSDFNEQDYIYKNADKIAKFEEYSKKIIKDFLIQ